MSNLNLYELKLELFHFSGSICFSVSLLSSIVVFSNFVIYFLLIEIVFSVIIVVLVRQVKAFCGFYVFSSNMLYASYIYLYKYLYKILYK